MSDIPADESDDAQKDDEAFFDDSFRQEADNPEAEAQDQEPDAGAGQAGTNPAGKIDRDAFKGYLDERDKRQRAEAESASLRAQLEHFQQSQRTEEQTTPDIYDDPEAFQRSLTEQLHQQLDQRLLHDRMNASEFYARKEHGDALIDEVKRWAQSLSPEQATVLSSQPMPYLAAVDAYRQHKAGAALAQFDYDIDALVASRSEARQDGLAGETAAQQGRWSKFPPRAGQSGGVQVSGSPVSDGEFFDSVFKR